MTEHEATDGRTARRDRNRLAVLDAVLDLFAAGDLSPSPEAVAQRSGLSLRSVYRYVADSDDLVHSAIERHLEKVRPLFAIAPPGPGSLRTRAEAFVTARLRLYEAVAPTARAAYLRAQLRSTPASDIVAGRLTARRRLLRGQLERQFAAEIADLGDQAGPLVAAADGLTQLETIDWYLTAGGYTLDQARDILVAGLGRLLGPIGTTTGEAPMSPRDDFDGVIGPTVAESVPSWPSRPHPGPDAPNVVVILLDDTGFAHLGCYGSTISTPNIDKLAADGLRYTNFHVTPLCSPTRAALLTGRNHHEVGMRSLANFSTGFPNMRGHVTNHAATMAELLRDEGYATFAVGKWHLCQMEDASAAGPYDQWPLARGFDRFYGFLDGETDQFHPELVYDNHAVDQPKSEEEGYHLTEDLVDRAIGFMHDSKSIRPDRPFFLYLAPGATHAPHQAPPEYLAKYRGAFDDGWDVARAAWFARQQEMGLFPATTQLAPRNPGVQEWVTMPENHRRLASRLQEAFAAFLEHTDAQIGRLVAALEHLGELDNTILLLLSDNGASQEGGQFGVLHEWKYFNFVIESPDDAVARIDDIGGPDSHTNYPWGWAQAGNTPFRWYKQNTHEGGVHVPLVVHWPRQIAQPDRGGLRDQFHHVNDLAPMIYDILGVTPPQVYRGYEQLPVTGVSMRYTLSGADEPSRKPVQYYEMMGHRAIYADGWKAVTRHTPGVPFDDDDWELYHVATDRSECANLASAEPDRLAAMVGLWWAQAREHDVLPLDDRTIELFGAREKGVVDKARAGLGGLAASRPDYTPHPADRHYVYRPPMSPMPAQAGARIGGRSWDLFATIDRPPGAGGALYASGNQNSGLSLFVQDDHLFFDYNCFGEHHLAQSGVEVPAGPSVVGVRFRRRPSGSGTATLVIDGAACGQVEIPFVMYIVSSIGPSVGYDHGSPVSDRYESPFTFQGTLDRVDIQIVSGRDAAAEAANADAIARAELSRQ